MMKRLLICALVTLNISVACAEYVYPAKGQSPEQQQKDEAECHTWAVDKSGYDPANPPKTQATTQPSGPTGSRLRGAAGGALIGEIADGDTGDVAIAGAVLGGSRERRMRRTKEQQAKNNAQEKQQKGQTEFNKARGACLEGRDYTVK